MRMNKKGRDSIVEDIYDKYEEEYKKSAARNSMSLYEFVQSELALEKQRAAQNKKVMARAVKKTTKEIAEMAKKERQAQRKKTTPTTKGKR